jgi:LysR family glycine cleavage system transcriptional activator
LQRTSNIPAAQRLEGFPLVHVDFYKDDPAKLAWPEWIAANHVIRTNPEFGTRFRRITHACDAICADVGFALCGIALLANALDDETIAPLYPVQTGRWSEHGFVATFRTDAPARNHVARFRSWLMAESNQTREWLAKRCC